MPEAVYQTNYSDLYAHRTGYENSRNVKAHKTLEVIRAYTQVSLNRLDALEIGCHKGAISRVLAPFFKSYHAVDIDRKAVEKAREQFLPENLTYKQENAEALSFPDAVFDVVICSHVYEHLPFPGHMIDETYRVLRADGFCYFAAGNKLQIIEPHYRLPLLSWLPKKLTHKYLQLVKKGNFYYENLYNFQDLKKLVRPFSIVDYTLKILKEPRKFAAEDMVREHSVKQKLAIEIYKNLRGMFPTYIWILRK
jgi:2-polyprenyl-3-methyl-5-hydroxy-6-metoxy-1,4-benzoquinol methylase